MSCRKEIIHSRDQSICSWWHNYAYIQQCQKWLYKAGMFDGMVGEI